MTFAKKVARAVATACGIGLSPVAPGTFGSLPGIALGWWLARGTLENPLFYSTLLVGFLAIGLWSVIVFEASTGSHDDQRVVIDEVMGQTLTFLPLPWLAPTLFDQATPTPLALAVCAVAFACFRLFDIWKPGPVGWIDREIHTPLGTYLDDLVAGLMAACLLCFILFAYFHWS